jgi:polar amino acid transport system substrate-binding protein
VNARRWLPLAAFALIASGCAATSVFPTPEARQALMPTGKLRVALNLGNPVLAKRDTTSGAVSGIAIDLGRALASRLEAEFVPVLYPNAGALVDGAKAGAWDVAFAAIDPARADTLEFTAPYMEVGVTYVVPLSSGIRTVADADRPGVRVGVGAKNAADLYLSRSLKEAQLVRVADTLDAAVELLQTGKADIYAGNRERLLLVREQLVGYRLLDGRFYAVEHAIALPRGRRPGLGFVDAFVEELKSSGAVAESIKRHSIRGVDVAPSAKGRAAAGQ